jgi:hypothetical protein
VPNLRDLFGEKIYLALLPPYGLFEFGHPRAGISRREPRDDRQHERYGRNHRRNEQK